MIFLKKTFRILRKEDGIQLFYCNYTTLGVARTIKSKIRTVESDYGSGGIIIFEV